MCPPNIDSPDRNPRADRGFVMPGGVMRNTSGYRQRKARERIRAMLPAPCWRCGVMIWPDEPVTVGHVVNVMDRPDLQDVPELQLPEHPRCNFSAGARDGNRKRRRIAPASRVW